VSEDAADSEHDLRAQLRALEERVAKLEAERAALRVPEPEPESQPAPRSRPDEKKPFEPPWPVPGAPKVKVPEHLLAHADEPAREARDESRRSEPADAARSRDFESFFGMTVLGRVGIAAIVTAAAYFGQIGWKHLGPGVRTVCIYLLGAAFVLLGQLLRSRVKPSFVAILWGGGTATLYLAGVLARLRFDVLSPPAAIVALLATAALGQLLARALRLEAMATIALAGAYVAPVLVGTPSPTPTAFFALLLSLHAWAAWTEHRWRWHAARLLAVAATVVLVIGWYRENGRVGPTSFFAHIAVVWSMLSLPELLRAWLRPPIALVRTVAIACAALVWTAVVAVEREGRPDVGLWLGGALLLAGAVYARRDAQLGAWLARVPSLALLIGAVRVVDRWEDPRAAWFVSAALAVGVLQLAARRWTRVGELGLFLAAAFSLLMHGGIGHPDRRLTFWETPLLLAAPLLLLLFARTREGPLAGVVFGVVACLVGYLRPDVLQMERSHCVAIAIGTGGAVAVLGVLLAARRGARLLGIVSVGLLSALVIGWLVFFVRQQGAPDGDPLPLLWNLRFVGSAALVLLLVVARRLTPVASETERVMLAGLALFVTYVAGLLEVLDLVIGLTFGMRAASTSLYTLAFAVCLLIAGFRARVDALRYVALGGFAIVAGKVALYDLREADTEVRVLVTGVLGAVLLAVAWGYARSRRSHDGEP